MTRRRLEDAHATPPPPAAAWKQRVRRRALAWFERNARDLPWRRTRDPYHVWVSEVMLQQTQVETVKPYFERFLRSFPTLASLAAAEREQVLRMWEGLGYYRRAGQLHLAAQRVVERHAGRLPENAAELLTLPGVGRYTAGAILSIAHDQPEPIVEANTVRLLSRLLGYRGDPTDAAGQAWLWNAAESLLPQRRVGQFNQALMEIGAEICKPRQPRCEACPLAALCTARLAGLVEAIPPPKRRPKSTELSEAAVVVHRGSKLLMHRYADGRRWAGLWDFVRFGLEERSPAAKRREIVEKVRELAGVEIELDAALAVLKHGVTRFRITLDCHRAKYVSGRVRRGDGAWKWVGRREIDRLPLSSTGRAIARLIDGAGKWPAK